MLVCVLHAGVSCVELHGTIQRVWYLSVIHTRVKTVILSDENRIYHCLSHIQVKDAPQLLP